MTIVAAPPARRARRRRADALAAERALFARYRRERDPALRTELVERALPLTRHLAARYDAPDHARDDIFQVACLALVKAVDRSDPDRGVAFSTYAVPTVTGEIKRYFRDQTWAVHVTREVQERALRLARAVPDAGRRPTIAQMAAAAGATEEETREALRAANAYRAASLEAEQRAGDGAGVTLAETLSYDDERLASAEQRADLATLVERLSPRERAVLRLRFERDLTYAQIAAILGVSSLHAARMLRGALERLRGLRPGGSRRPTCRRRGPR
jgi:RNA polymerase sigma-B factor